MDMDCVWCDDDECRPWLADLRSCPPSTPCTHTTVSIEEPGECSIVDQSITDLLEDTITSVEDILSVEETLNQLTSNIEEKVEECYAPDGHCHMCLCPLVSENVESMDENQLNYALRQLLPCANVEEKRTMVRNLLRGWGQEPPHLGYVPSTTSDFTGLEVYSDAIHDEIHGLVYQCMSTLMQDDVVSKVDRRHLSQIAHTLHRGAAQAESNLTMEFLDFDFYSLQRNCKSILDLPHSVIQSVLSYLPFGDLQAVKATCRVLCHLTIAAGFDVVIGDEYYGEWGAELALSAPYVRTFELDSYDDNDTAPLFSKITGGLMERLERVIVGGYRSKSQKSVFPHLERLAPNVRHVDYRGTHDAGVVREDWLAITRWLPRLKSLKVTSDETRGDLTYSSDCYARCLQSLCLFSVQVSASALQSIFRGARKTLRSLQWYDVLIRPSKKGKSSRRSSSEIELPSSSGSVDNAIQQNAEKDAFRYLPDCSGLSVVKVWNTKGQQFDLSLLSGFSMLTHLHIVVPAAKKDDGKLHDLFLNGRFSLKRLAIRFDEALKPREMTQIPDEWTNASLEMLEYAEMMFDEDHVDREDALAERCTSLGTALANNKELEVLSIGGYGGALEQLLGLKKLLALQIVLDGRRPEEVMMGLGVLARMTRETNPNLRYLELARSKGQFRIEPSEELRECVDKLEEHLEGLLYWRDWIRCHHRLKYYCYDCNVTFAPFRRCCFGLTHLLG